MTLAYLLASIGIFVMVSANAAPQACTQNLQSRLSKPLSSEPKPRSTFRMLPYPVLSPRLLSLWDLKPKLSEEGNLHLFHSCHWTEKGVKILLICYSVLKCMLSHLNHWNSQSFPYYEINTICCHGSPLAWFQILPGAPNSYNRLSRDFRQCRVQSSSPDSATLSC